MKAILSVSNKAGLAEFAQGLARLRVDIYSTGGTKRSLTEAGVAVHSISDLTGFPEILDGRVKSLHPAVHGGLLARRDKPAHMDELAKQGIGPIDLVAVNLYPFVETVIRAGVTLDDALENIDIGGPTMIRAAAKNLPAVLVVVEPSDYATVLERLAAGEVPLEFRQRLAQKAFQHVAIYDTAIAEYLRPAEDLPAEMTLAMVKKADMRYGENPHQRAAFYVERSVRTGRVPGLATAAQLHGKELSYNNIMDADAAWAAATDFVEPTIAIIKHTNPCGLASDTSLVDAYRRAFAGDPVSAFGGIVASNRPIDAATAEEIRPTFYEIVIAPSFDEAALAILKRKRDLRILATGGLPEARDLGWDVRRVRGGYLVQDFDVAGDEGIQLKTVTKREPTPAELDDLLFGWRAAKHVKSNSIVLAKARAIVGMGAGQPNRVTSVHLALRRAEERSRGSVLASDAFFPFPDGVEMAAGGGVTAVIQPGGSIRDEEVVAEADKHNIAMVFTGVRHFRH
ncbi:MAG: bifunctional phosphoribosylaminoimidazolecarboxamide formyltransferase/IMP cyclohydrolase [Chloroflexi bacterium]|nr:bifunctional phosphoribosylaminoimidazolecarboxamide formyltransferase/IMP cyclohydrolase [Chloroflexota bacterium]